MYIKEAHELLHKYLACDEKILECSGMCSLCPDNYDRFKTIEALKVIDSALENIDNIMTEFDSMKKSHLCFTCASNCDGRCETQNVIYCKGYERGTE